MAGVGQLAASRQILVVVGPGGVGKTTLAASLAARTVVEIGGSVLVLTVDPARRLASALGLSRFGNETVEVPTELFTRAGVRPRGSLHVAMLDTKAAWDGLIHRHAPDEQTEQAILANPLYRNIASTFVASHDYVAMEELYELHRLGRYDLIVVDTPPARRAIDFLEAPSRMVEFFGSPLLAWLTMPGRSRSSGFAQRPFHLVANRLIGSTFLADIAEFFLLFQSMYEGFVDRSDAVSAVFGERLAGFVVVSTLEREPVVEAEFLCDELERRELEIGAVVANRVLPEGLRDDAAASAARRLAAAPESVVDRLGNQGLDHLGLVLAELADNYLRYRSVAAEEVALSERLAARAGAWATVPLRASGVSDLAGLLEIGRHLWVGL